MDIALATEIVLDNSGCCGRNFNCFLTKLNLPQAAQIVYLCRQDLHNNTTSKSDVKDVLRYKLDQCVDGFHDNSDYFRMLYKITPQTKTRHPMEDRVCRKTFLNAWGFRDSLRKRLCREIKDNRMKSAHAFTDRFSAVDYCDVQKLVESCNLQSVITNPEKLNIAFIANTEASFYCHNWLENYFNLCADDQPNLNEKHLDPVHKKDVYLEYEHEAILYNIKPLSITRFRRAWKTGFPHVKIRKYKACSGKCYICAELSKLTREKNTRAALEYIKLCRIIHRADFMRDRDLYSQRKKLAELYPSQYLSMITDGMQQTHCELPYSGNQLTCSNKLKQHLQGITAHFRRTRMYRTLDHIFLGRNACIYTILSELEEEYKLNGKLPKIVYIQIDGGSENANYAVLAWMEIIISLEIGVEEIWVCRLRVGHNHADQDAKFGLLWKKIRSEFLLSPQAYERKVAEVLSEGGNPAKLIDMIVIPDLLSPLEGFMDKDLERCFKGVYTQHIFRFQKVPASEAFPLGSKMTYRASALDEFFEFVKCSDSPIGMAPRKVLVDWYPANGMRALTTRPSFDDIKPSSFEEGTVEHMSNVISAISSTSVHPDISKEWETFRELLPTEWESPDDFLQRRGEELHIPFKDLLRASGKPQSMSKPDESVRLQESIPVSAYDICVETVAAGACLRWSGCRKPEPARVTLDGRRDAVLEDQKLRRSRKIRWKFDPKLVEVGVTLYVMASTWKEYELSWPYPFPLEAAYVRGIVF